MQRIGSKLDPDVIAILNAINDLRKKYQGRTYVISADELFSLIMDNFGFIDAIFSRYMDRKWRYVALNTFKDELRADFIHLLKYIPDYFDCDNYAHSFKNIMDILFGVSAIGVAYGKLYYGGAFVGYHAFNVVLVDVNGEKKFVVYEPQTMEYEFAQGKKTEIGDWTYEILSMDWY